MRFSGTRRSLGRSRGSQRALRGPKGFQGVSVGSDGSQELFMRFQKLFRRPQGYIRGPQGVSVGLWGVSERSEGFIWSITRSQERFREFRGVSWGFQGVLGAF